MTDLIVWVFVLYFLWNNSKKVRRWIAKQIYKLSTWIEPKESQLPLKFPSSEGREIPETGCPSKLDAAMHCSLTQVFNFNSFMTVLKTFQTYTLNSDQDAILVQMLAYFSEMGLPEDWDQEAFDSLFQEVYDPN